MMFKGNKEKTTAFKFWESLMPWRLNRWEVVDMFDQSDRLYVRNILDNDPRLGVTHGNFNGQGTDTKFYNLHDVFEIAYLIKWGDGG